MRRRYSRDGGMTRAELRAENRRGSKAWEVWSEGDRWEGPIYIASYSDKGEAERHMRRLQKSNRGYRYYLKHKKVASRHLSYGGRKTRKARAHWQRKMGW